MNDNEDIFCEMSEIYDYLPPLSLVKRYYDKPDYFSVVYKCACDLLAALVNKCDSEIQPICTELSQYSIDTVALCERLKSYIFEASLIPTPSGFLSRKHIKYGLEAKFNQLWISDYQKKISALNYSLYKNYESIRRAQENIKMLKLKCGFLFRKSNKSYFYEYHDELILLRRRLKGFERRQRKLKAKIRELQSECVKQQ